jgi:glycosyltransferase A (GT-A) superfamily protein (DUF2064 family)
MATHFASRTGAPGQISVLAKEPVPGAVKTRLCPPLTPSDAARLHEAFVADTLARLATLGRPLALHAHSSRAAMGETPILSRIAAAVGARLLAQQGAHLGERMA